MGKKNIAIVVPCFNEEGVINKLVQEVDIQREKLSKKYSIDLILINDGSSDNTQEIIQSLSDRKDYVYFRSFARNAGHQSALRAGIDACLNYDAVIMMDADLQHPPSLIGKLVSEWEEGAQIVQMIRQDDSNDSGFMKHFTSKLYYKLINRISSLNIEYGASDFRIIDRSVVEMVASSNETELFLRGYFAWLPVKRTSIPYRPAKRFAGSSKYTFKKMLDLAIQGVLQFSEKPLQLSMNIGILMAISSFVYGLIIVASYALGSYTVSGWTSLMVVLLFCFGVNFVLLGIIGKYLAQVIKLTKSRPDYVVFHEKLKYAL
jgi:dolichol-phosphate mannosyltransferase